MFKLSQIKNNPANPRFIKDDKFEKLVYSIVLFPQMMQTRPIIVDENFYALGGNMRDKACIEISNRGKEFAEKLLKDSEKHTPEQVKSFLQLISPLFKGNFPDGWIKQESNWTEEQKRQFILKDNASYGQWDFEILANEWDIEDLADSCVEIPNLDFATEPLEEEEEKRKVNKIVFTFPISEDYESVKISLDEIADSYEAALMTLIQFYEEKNR